MQLVCKSQSKILILQHSYVICLIRESGFIPVMINAEYIFLVFAFLLNPSLFRRGENFGHDLPCVCQLFFLALIYSTVPLIDLQMSLGLVSQGILHNTGLCPQPFSSRCVPCLQLYSCSKHTSLSSSLLSMQCCTTSSLKVKVSIQSNLHEQSASLPPLVAFIPPPVLDQQSCIYIVLHLSILAEIQS